MESKDLFTPKLRFPGFTGSWEQHKLKELFTFKYGDGNNNPSNGGPYPVFGAGGIQGGYTEFNTEDSVIIGHMGDAGCVSWGEGKHFVTYNGTITKPKDNVFSPKFGYYLLSKMDLRKYRGGSGLPFLTYDMLNDMDTIIPYDKSECEKISEYFSELDNIISLHHRRCESMKEYKKGMLQKMFPKSGEQYPEIRFPGFADPWEQRKLGEIFEERHIFSKISNDYPRLSFTIEEGVISPEDRKTNKRDFLMKDEANKKFLITMVGDIIYNPANVVFGAIHRNSLKNGCLSPIYRIFTTSQDSRFMECIVRSPLFISKLAQRTEGSVIKLKTLKPEAFLGMEVAIAPEIEEQTKIADTITALDNLITLHQRKPFVLLI